LKKVIKWIKDHITLFIKGKDDQVVVLDSVYKDPAKKDDTIKDTQVGFKITWKI
jgi:hypothetical protein